MKNFAEIRRNFKPWPEHARGLLTPPRGADGAATGGDGTGGIDAQSTCSRSDFDLGTVAANDTVMLHGAVVQLNYCAVHARRC